MCVWGEYAGVRAGGLWKICLFSFNCAMNPTALKIFLKILRNSFHYVFLRVFFHSLVYSSSRWYQTHFFGLL
jgi:hypothetical protein